MITLIEWLSALFGTGVTAQNEFIFFVIAGVLVVIAFTCALSLFIGIVFSLFRR